MHCKSDHSSTISFCSQIITRSNDEVALILIGSADTYNDLNRERGGYNDISLALQMKPVNWNILRYIHKQMRVPSEYTTADWLDGLTVAISYFQALEWVFMHLQISIWQKKIIKKKYFVLPGYKNVWKKFSFSQRDKTN